jgi:uncharacterized protein YndB with AHSA1/START domain
VSDISHEIKIKASQERVYQALTTVSDLTKWHTAKMDGGAALGNVLRIHPQNGPEFEWKVIKTDSGRRIEWKCIKGPGNSVGTTVRFDLSPADKGRTYLEFLHSDWPNAGGNFRKCNTLWGILLYHLQKYAETQKSDPAFN